MGQSTRFLKSVHAISTLKSKGESGLGNADQKLLDVHMAALRIWQSERLKKTHSDILKNPRYGPACEFFLNDIYAPKDFSQRDNDIEYLYEIMSSVLPKFLLKLVRNTISLNNLTSLLDNKLLEVLKNSFNSPFYITPERYSEAYRICNNYDDRKKQIDLLIEIGKEVDAGTKIPLVTTALRFARGPAERAGWIEVHQFLEDGFIAFKKMRGADKFLMVIEKREKNILDRIFSGEENPFQDPAIGK